MATSEEIRLSFEWADLELVGSLHLPTDGRPSAAVLMAQGSGPADRNSDGYFAPVREAFLERGLATFSFDKPGCGESSGNWRHHGLRERAEQVLAALETVREHPAIDRRRVGLWGHSQGGWVVQMLAGESRDLAFAIANSAPTIGVKEQILHDVEQSLRAVGHDGNDITRALAHIRSVHRAAGAGESFEQVVGAVLEPARKERWFADVPSLSDADDWRHLVRLVSEPFEPRDVLRGVRCPFLAVYGGRDPLLPPWQGAHETGEALVAAGTTDATVVVFPLGDHRIQSGADQRFVDGYLQLLGDWTSLRAT